MKKIKKLTATMLAVATFRAVCSMFCGGASFGGGL